MRRLAFALVGAILVAGCGSSATPSPAPSSAPPPSGTLHPTLKPSNPPAVTPTPAPGETATPAPTPTPDASTKTYKILKGDTFTKIAKKFGITVDALQAANPKVKPTSLHIGATLIIPPKP